MKKTRSALFRGRHLQDHVIVLCVRWYLRYCLTLRDLEELMMERGLTVDHSTIGRWVLRYAPELNKRMFREIRLPNRSWRVDETYVRVAGKWTYLYRAVDCSGETIDFMLSPKRDAVAAKQFLQLVLWQSRQIRPRVINVDGHAGHPPAVAELKASGELSRRCRCRPVAYLNNVLEQDHRFVKKRIAASLWFRSVDGAIRTIVVRGREYDPQRAGEVVGKGRDCPGRRGSSSNSSGSLCSWTAASRSMLPFDGNLRSISSGGIRA